MMQGLEIIEVKGRRLLDSEGLPAVEAQVGLENGARGRAVMALTGENEETDRMMETLAECILFEDASDQRGIDRLLEESGGACKETKDGGFLTAVSMAAARAGAAGLGMPLYRYLGGIAPRRLPVPMMTMISGGRHGRNNSLDMESFMIVPVSAASFAAETAMCMEVYQTLKRLLSVSGHQTGVGDDGGFVPDMRNSEEALAYIAQAVKLCGYKLGSDMMMAIGAGAKSLYDESAGVYRFKGESRMTGITVERNLNDMIALYIRLLDGYPICAVFDGLTETNVKERSLVTKLLGNRAAFIGRQGIGAGQNCLEENAVGITLCEAKSVTKAMEMAEQAKNKGLRFAVCQDYGETEDPFAADFAAAVNADWIRAGAPCRSEHTSKYNELLRIEEWMNGRLR